MKQVAINFVLQNIRLKILHFAKS